VFMKDTKRVVVLIDSSADDLQEILEDPDSQSPDLGPPPVSRFDNEGPISYSTGQVDGEQPEENNEDGERALSVNLETRRKRRESGPKLNIRRVSVFESPPENTQELSRLAQSGSLVCRKMRTRISPNRSHSGSAAEMAPRPRLRRLTRILGLPLRTGRFWEAVSQGKCFQWKLC
jgi:hypothetical protein